jgi:hypothetical protein
MAAVSLGILKWLIMKIGDLVVVYEGRFQKEWYGIIIAKGDFMKFGWWVLISDSEEFEDGVYECLEGDMEVINE